MLTTSALIVVLMILMLLAHHFFSSLARREAAQSEHSESRNNAARCRTWLWILLSLLASVWIPLTGCVMIVLLAIAANREIWNIHAEAVCAPQVRSIRAPLTMSVWVIGSSAIWFGLCLASLNWLITSVLFFILISIIDVAQYLFGKLAKRLALESSSADFILMRFVRSISPQKTFGGYLGGLLVTLLISPFWTMLLEEAGLAMPSSLLLLFGCFALFALAGFMGDLAASAYKRSRGAKNFSAILPGHGGILDRLDSFYLALPIIMLLLVPLQFS